MTCLTTYCKRPLVAKNGAVREKEGRGESGICSQLSHSTLVWGCESPTKDIAWSLSYDELFFTLAWQDHYKPYAMGRRNVRIQELTWTTICSAAKTAEISPAASIGSSGCNWMSKASTGGRPASDSSASLHYQYAWFEACSMQPRPCPQSTGREEVLSLKEKID